VHHLGRILALPANIKLGRKGLPGTNALVKESLLKGRLRTADLLIKIACFEGKKNITIIGIKNS
jgi:hypothetical protein